MYKNLFRRLYTGKYTLVSITFFSVMQADHPKGSISSTESLAEKISLLNISKPSSAEFGGRPLKENENPFTQNAWDNIEWTIDDTNSALDKIEVQKSRAVSDSDQLTLDSHPNKYWDKFYESNGDKFFKDRKWLSVEFPELFSEENTDLRVLEVGCGAGNTFFPFVDLKSHTDSFVYACDYSSQAVNLITSSPSYNPSKSHAFVFDITCLAKLDEIPENSLDFITCIFVLSAINPNTWNNARDNLFKLLKPGGVLLIRDYGIYDMTQLRFKNGFMGDSWYKRGDGTRVYFFTNEELGELFGGKDWECLQNVMDRRLLVNRAKQLKMYRCWVQAKFKKI